MRFAFVLRISDHEVIQLFGIPLEILLRLFHLLALVLLDQWFDLTALHVAILANQQVICKYLIEMRADLEAKAKKGGKWSDLTPLHVAVIASSAAICRLLIEMGADVNAKAQKGFFGFYEWSDLTPLHVAVVEKNAAIFRLLIGMGADMGAKAQKVSQV
eukprot:c20655_g1_i9.p1 GENE.c20655_g1_i9~~c20655_g1_i9.p1  ORF type:complete len:159 (+),score=27.52 c20655_g1_i9:503-979(+)